MNNPNTLLSKTQVFLIKYRKEHPFIFYFMVIYLGGLLLYISIFLIFFADHTIPIPLNEMGDFLAGIFSPVAFLFLILGYLQQKKVITDNTEILREQMEELRLSKQLMIESNQPLLNFTDISHTVLDESNSVNISCRIKNENQNCQFKKITFIEEADKISTFTEYGYLMRGESLEIQIRIRGLTMIEPALLFKVIYIDIFGNEKESLYILEYNSETTKIKKCPTRIEIQFHADEY